MRIKIDNELQTSREYYQVGGGIASERSDQPRQSSQLTERHKQQSYDRAMASLIAKMSSFTPYSESGQAFLESFVRSDLVINLPDESGWRKPSSYVAEWRQDAIASSANGPWAYFEPKYTTGYHIGYYWQCFFSGAYGVHDFVQPLSIPFHSGPSGNVENRLLAKSLSQLRNQKFDLALAVLESQDTFKTLTGLLRKLQSILKAIRKKDLRELQKAFGFRTKNRNAKGVYTKDSASLWLEAMYGVRPLLYDIYGLCELAQSKMRKGGFRIRVSSHLDYSEDETSILTPSNPHGKLITGKIHTTHNVTQKVSLWYELDDENFHLAEALGLTNPALWVWEKTTLSFVVDWLLPVGDVLAGLSSDLGFKYLGGTHTYYSQSSGYGENVAIKVFPNLKNYEVINIDRNSRGGVNTPYARCGRMERKVYKTSPKPGFFIKDPFSVNNVITTVALIGSAFAKTR